MLLPEIFRNLIFISQCKHKVKVKCKFTRTGHEGPEDDWICISTLSLTSALDGEGGQRHAAAALSPGMRPGTHSKGGSVGSRAPLGGHGKFRAA